MTEFPIDALLPELCRQLRPGQTVLLQAPPGAGKTTRVPLALMRSLAARSGLIWLVEPRRLATRAAAARLADSLGEPVGERIGYAMRGEQKRSQRTRVEVITDGLLLRRLQADPALERVSCILFDEFHERRRDADLALTLLREAAPLLHPELILLLMSATLDMSDLRSRLPEAVVLESAGRAFPVDTEHQVPRPDESLGKQVLRALENHALDLKRGSGALVFLPGIREIERCRALLQDAAALQQWRILTLHGQCPLDAQSAALQRCGPEHHGTVILASAIAESSVTIDGVRLVIDSGLSRQLRYDPNTGMEGLETVASSLASAEQRRGRAGRQAPGRCIRLWSPAEQQRRAPFSCPELLLADPKPVLIELAQWGAGMGEELPWLDPPPAAAMQEGRQELQVLGLLASDGRLTPTGQLLNGLGVHPRLGLLMLEARRKGCARLGCDLAAVLSERDPLTGRAAGSDLAARLQALKRHRALAERSRQLLRQLERLPLSTAPASGCASAADLVLTAFPDWIAQERPGQPGRYRLRQGRGAILAEGDPLLGSPGLAVARVDSGGRDTRIQLALPLSAETLRNIAERDGRWQDCVRWDSDVAQIKAEQQLQLGALVIQRRPQPAPTGEHCRRLLVQVLQEAGTLDALPWTPAIDQLRVRLQWMHRHRGAAWPARSLSALQADLDAWLGPQLVGCRSWKDLTPTMLEDALWGELDWSRRQELGRLLPSKLAIPSGRQAALCYDDEAVVLAVKLQEMFGCEESPRVLEGVVPVTLELLSPAGRPLQRTSDLAHFWEGSYQDIRREMRGRYPKHPWPENPRIAPATAKTKRRLELERSRPNKHTNL